MIMIKHTYISPSCESDSQWELAGLLATSDLTDSGAGDFLEDGGEIVF